MINHSLLLILVLTFLQITNKTPIVWKKFQVWKSLIIFLLGKEQNSETRLFVHYTIILFHLNATFIFWNCILHLNIPAQSVANKRKFTSKVLVYEIWCKYDRVSPLFCLHEAYFKNQTRNKIKINNYLFSIHFIKECFFFPLFFVLK